MEPLYAYTRVNRPPGNPLEYDRMVCLMLKWMDTHKVKEVGVFLAQEGKEYPLMLRYLEDELHIPDVEIDSELLNLAWGARITPRRP